MVRVRLQGVTKRFGSVVAVECVDIEIERGEFYFLLGPSGCGKTTLLRTVAGFYRPEHGRVFFDDRDVTGVPPEKRNTGMVFQNYALWPHMTVWQNVEYGLSLRDIAPRKRADRIRRALQMVRMEGYRDRSPNQLSGGQQQRVALARALVIEPDVVLLDEPLSNLDARLRLEMREQIQALHQSLGITMIYVTHDQKEALAMASRVAVMQAGRVVQSGSPRTLYSKPANRFVADFIGEINLISGKVVLIDENIGVKTGVGVLYGGPGYDGIRRGDRVLCAIRPEAMEFHAGSPGEADHVVAGTVRNAIFLGEMEQYVVDLSDGTQVKLLESHPRVRSAFPGDRVSIRFARDSISILRDEGENSA
ncbi:MAG: ABC transporter ATP-binding protein [Gemmatimonadota bacterium]|nr:ABC transporter ATP-binding protein [Gemmatimonadota bacterium]